MRSRKGENIFMDYIDVHAHGFPESYLRQFGATYPAEVQVEEASGTTPTCSARSIDPFTSANRTVTCLRSPSRAERDVRIFSARCLRVYERGRLRWFWRCCRREGATF